MVCDASGYCSRKAYMGFGSYHLCRKHTAHFQANRKADLRNRGIDPITAQSPTAEEIRAWVIMPAGHFEA